MALTRRGAARSLAATLAAGAATQVGRDIITAGTRAGGDLLVRGSRRVLEAAEEYARDTLAGFHRENKRPRLHPQTPPATPRKRMPRKYGRSSRTPLRRVRRTGRLSRRSAGRRSNRRRSLRSRRSRKQVAGRIKGAVGSPWNPPYTEFVQTKHTVVSAMGLQGYTEHNYYTLSQITNMQGTIAPYIPQSSNTVAVVQPTESSTDIVFKILPSMHFVDITSDMPASQYFDVTVFKCIKSTNSGPSALANAALSQENDFHMNTAFTDVSMGNVLHFDPSTVPRVREFWRPVFKKKLFMQHGDCSTVKFMIRPKRYVGTWMMNTDSFQPGLSFIILFRSNGTPVHDSVTLANVTSSQTQFDLVHRYTYKYQFKTFTNPSFTRFSYLSTVTNPEVMNWAGRAEDVPATA